MKKQTCPQPPENLLERCLETIPMDTLETRPRRGLLLDIPSQRRLRWLTAATVALAVAGILVAPVRTYLASRAGGSAETQLEKGITAVKFTAIPCTISRCDETDTQGKVQIVYTDGTKQDIKGDHVFFRRATENDGPQVSPDHRTAGWLEGEHRERQNIMYFLPEHLILYRNQRVLHVLEGELAFIEAWCFWDGGKQVVFRSRRFHGPSAIELYDVESGKRLNKISGYKVTASSPEWAQKLKD